MQWIRCAFGIATFGVCFASCEKEAAKPAPPATSSVAAAASTPPAPAPVPAPSTTAAEKKPVYPCPDRSAGGGTFDDPCKAKGKTRLMDVSATTKIGDKGPTFKIINNAKHDVLYGKIVVYFYDKAHKQIDAPGDKPRHRLMCAGNIFGGVVKPGEKIFMNFSCVKKDDVPKGVVAIEGEIQTVGVTEDGTKIDSYWRNDDLVPEDRPKGGIK
jgi:hypothetical protein